MFVRINRPEEMNIQKPALSHAAQGADKHTDKHASGCWLWADHRF